MAIKATSPADVIAAAIHGLGFTPTNAIVVNTLHDKRMSATLRMDLPALGSDYSSYIMTLINHLSSDQRATGSVVMLFTEEPDSDGDNWPYAELMEPLEAMLEAAGKPVLDMWLVTPEHWQCYGCTESDCEQHPISEVTDSVVNATLTHQGSDPRRTVAYNAPFEGPFHAYDTIQAMVESLDFGPYDFEDMKPYREQWDFAITHVPERWRKLDLIAMLQHPGLRDRIMVDTFTMDEDEAAFGRVVLGNITEKPDWEKVDAVEALLKSLLPLAPGETRAAIFTFLGWLSWIKGQATLGGQYLALALEEAPAYTMAGLLQQIISRATLAPINRHEGLSYSSR